MTNESEGTRVLTFEEWQIKAFAGGLGGGYSIAEKAWHARDAEIADLQRQLDESEHKGWCDALRNVLGSIEGYPDHGGDIEIMTAIERIVQERVAEALPSRDQLAKLIFEIDNKPGDAEWPEDWAIQPYCRWALRDADKILAALRKAAEAQPAPEGKNDE